MNVRPRALLVATIVAALTAGCGNQDLAPSREPAGGASTGPGSDPLASPIVVRKPIGPSERGAMVRWMNRWRGCMRDKGVDLPPVVIHSRDVSVDVSAVAGYVHPGAPLPANPPPFMRKSQSCIATFGDPKWTFLRTAGIVDLFVGSCSLQQNGSPRS